MKTAIRLILLGVLVGLGPMEEAVGVTLKVVSGQLGAYEVSVGGQDGASTIEFADPQLRRLTVVDGDVECTIYDETLSLMLSFDGVGSLGEDYGRAGGLVADASICGNNGRAGSVMAAQEHLPVWTRDGRFGGAIDYSGNGIDKGQSIHVPHADSLNPGRGDFAIVFWLLTRASYDGDVLRKGSTYTAGTWYKVEHSGGGAHNRLSLNFNTDSRDAAVNSGQAYADEMWHFVVAQRHGTTAQLWVDGQLKGSAGISGAIENVANLAVGSKDTQNDDFLNGVLDEVRIFRRSFGPDEIALMGRCNLAAAGRDRWLFAIEPQPGP